MPIGATRALLDAALSGDLDGVEYSIDPTFGIEVPVEAPGVDSALLDPRSTWSDPGAYDAKAAELARMFRANFARFDGVDADVRSRRSARARARQYVSSPRFPGCVSNMAAPVAGRQGGRSWTGR